MEEIWPYRRVKIVTKEGEVRGIVSEFNRESGLLCVKAGQYTDRGSEGNFPPGTYKKYFVKEEEISTKGNIVVINNPLELMRQTSLEY